MRSNTATRWIVTLAFALFAGLTVVMLLLLLTGQEAPSGGNLAILLVVAGLAVAGIGALPQTWSAEPQKAGWLQWTSIGTGLLLWTLAPIVALVAGADWATELGSTRKAPPLWLLALLVWSAAAGAIAVAISTLVKRRRARRRLPRPSSR